MKQILNQLKIGNTVYDLAAKYDSSGSDIETTYFKKGEMPQIEQAVKGAENVNATIAEGNIFEVTDRTGQTKTLNLNAIGGTSAGFGEIAATVDNSIGTPSVTVTTSGTNEAKNFTFEFTGLKGEKGDKGEVGMQGNSGVADASNKTLVNDAITGGETDFLSAEVGKLGILTYDCSKGGSVTHATLQDAINSVPTTFQKVGLTITYKSEDTIYRYTLKANAWSADPINWFSVEDKLNDLVDKTTMGTELDKKFDKESVAQESGSAEDKVMSQKATTTAIADETTRAKAAEEAILFDVSAHNSGVVFESLSALLSSSNLSTLIPTSVRHGGMSIRFIQGSEQGSDNKYVQYRLLTTSFSTTESDWTKGGGDGIYDISKNNGGITYIDLTAALGTNGANVPSSIRKGGMSIMFIKAIPATYNVEKTDGLAEAPSEGTLLESAPSVESGIYTASQLSAFATLPESTTATAVVYYVAVTANDTTTYTTWRITMATAYVQKYEQYRLMKDSWSTVVTDWQGVDDKPVYKSDNLAKSGSLYSLTEKAVGYDDFEDIKDQLSVAYDKAMLQNGVIVSGFWPANLGFITTPLQVYKNDIVKITANYYRYIDAISIDNGDGTYITVATGNSSGGTFKWTATKDCKVVFSGNDWNIAEIYLLRASRVEIKVNRLVWKKRVIEFNTELTPGLPNTKVTLGQTFPFGGHNNQSDKLRGIFEVKEGEKVYFSTLPEITNNFSGCAVLDKDYIVISLTSATNEIYFQVPAAGKYVVF